MLELLLELDISLLVVNIVSGNIQAGSGVLVIGDDCYDWVSSEEGKTSETGRSAELAFVQRDWS